jgi:hypothetical protein
MRMLRKRIIPKLNYSVADVAAEPADTNNLLTYNKLNTTHEN